MTGPPLFLEKKHICFNLYFTAYKLTFMKCHLWPTFSVKDICSSMHLFALLCFLLEILQFLNGGGFIHSKITTISTSLTLSLLLPPA